MATSYEVRDELTAFIEKDLLGPWEGQEEELPPGSAPRERYLVGMLGPKDAGADPETTDMELGDDVDGSDPEMREIAPLHPGGRIYASSMGLSFCVPQDVRCVVVDVEWGHYRKATSEKYFGKDGQTGRTVWRRHPISNRIELPLNVSSFDEKAHESFEDVRLRAKIRRRDRRVIVDVALVNGQEVPETGKDQAWLFQPKLTVTALDGAQAVFLPMSDPNEWQPYFDSLDFEDRHLALLYRDVLEHTVGRNVAVDVADRDGERNAYRLETTWLPSHEIPQTVAPTVEDTPQLAGLELRMRELARLSAVELKERLAPLADGYADWLDDRLDDIGRLPEHLRETAGEALRRAEDIAQRIRKGIDLLGDDEDAHKAFHFANEAMALQRLHSEIVRSRTADPGLTFEEAEREAEAKGEPAWRPFQLAFVLLNLPSLTDPGHPERAADRDAVVDLLFFPTGGGKTEAYLGLTAYTLAIRRIQGLVGEGELQRDGRDGTAVLMRYTLRLLTAQQFQRAATLICACEQLRVRYGLGDRPFRIGLWVGSAVSPNWYGEAVEQVTQARDGKNVRSSALQVLSCPWCGTALRADRDLHPDDNRRRILLFCGDRDGACEFSRKKRAQEGLPILTVDEEIYRLTPSLVIATVDKLARLPWAGYAATLFGQVAEWCPRHGYRHADMDRKTKCGARHNKLPGADLVNSPWVGAVQSQSVVRLRPPDLIIQDELHLISGALGTAVGLFEAAVDELCTWGAKGPKIVASTATVKRAKEQVHQLFARRLAVFPPPVLGHSDTFFSKQVEVKPQAPGRRYLGVCAHGVRLKQAEIRLTEILLLAPQTLFDRYGAAADPYMTLVGYFNATRELAGMRRYLDDDVATRVRRNGLRRGMSDRLLPVHPMLEIRELTSRVPSGAINEALRQLDVPFDPGIDSTAARKAVLEELRRARAEKRDPRTAPLRSPMPVDVVLATSMLQVGVDVSRLGLMVVTGQPKNTAEYIQASSRVGRDARNRPGLVVTLYNWSRPRDLAHFEGFVHYHATVYKEVEALSVTPYARRALDRGFAGAFVASVRNVQGRYSRNRDAEDVPLDGDLVTGVRDRLIARAEHVAKAGEYVREKADALLDAWAGRRSADYRLGYQTEKTEKENIAGLLAEPGGREWTVLTVGQSMRETENEVNLLLPGQTLADPSIAQASPWTWPDGHTEVEEPAEPASDELGEVTS